MTCKYFFFRDGVKDELKHEVKALSTNSYTDRILTILIQVSRKWRGRWFGRFFCKAVSIELRICPNRDGAFFRRWKASQRLRALKIFSITLSFLGQTETVVISKFPHVFLSRYQASGQGILPGLKVAHLSTMITILCLKVPLAQRNWRQQSRLRISESKFEEKKTPKLS